MTGSSRICILTIDAPARLPPLLSLACVLGNHGIGVDIVFPHRATREAEWERCLDSYLDADGGVKFSPILTADRPTQRGRLGTAKWVFSFARNARRLVHTEGYGLVIGVNHIGLYVASCATRFGRRIPMLYLQYEFFLLSEWFHPFNIWETLFARCATLVACVEENRARLLKAKAGLRDLPYVVLNCPRLRPPVTVTAEYDVHAFFPEATTHVMIYTGSMYRKHTCLDELISSALFWDPGIVLVVFGYGDHARRAELERLTISLGVTDRISWRAPVPGEVLRKYVASADAGVVFWAGDEANYRYAAPAKLFQYLEAGLPVIGSLNPLLTEVVDKGECGVCTNAHVPEDIARAANLLFSQETDRQRMGHRSRTLYETVYNMEMQAEPLVRTIISALKDRAL